jgi:hypothetical protein
MLNREYRVLVAGILAGAVLFSPLLCGMSCLESNGIGPSAAVESAPRPEELAAQFVGSAQVGCVLSHLISKIDFREWADQVDVVTWVWVGVEVLRMSDEAWRGEVLWR